MYKFKVDLSRPALIQPIISSLSRSKRIAFMTEREIRGRTQGSDNRAGGKDKGEKTGLGQGPSPRGQATSLETNADCIIIYRQKVGEEACLWMLQ